MSVNPALVAAHVARVHSPDHALTVAWNGVTWTDESPFVFAMRGIESVDPQISQVNTSEINVTLDNSTGRYTPSNAASPIYAHLTHAGQRVRVSLGYDGALAQVGTFWIDDMIPNERDGTVDMRLLDRGAWLDGRNVNVGPAGNIRTDDVIRLICNQIGLVEGTDYTCEVGETICQYAAAVNAPALAELQAVAFAEGGRIFIDPEGVIRFLRRSTHRALLAQPKATLRRSEVAYEAPRIRARRAVNRVILEYEDRDRTIADELVYVQTTPLGIAAATTWTHRQWAQVENPPGTFTFQPVEPPITAFAHGSLTVVVRGMDRTRWERSLPLIFTTIASITANTAPDGSGTNVPVTMGMPSPMSGFATTLHVLWTPNGSTGTLTFWNAASVPVYVRVLTINGRPARTVSPFAVTVDDVDAQADGVVEATIHNAYLPSSELAVERARDLLFFRSGQRARIDPQMDGAPYLRPLDAFAFIDDSVAPEVTEYLQVLKNEWSYGPDGYTCTLRTAPALPPTDRALVTSVAAPTDGALVTATDSAPWHWANPFFTGDVKVASSPFPWVADVISGYANRAPLSTSTDVPAGNPTAFSALFGFSGVSDQMGIIRLPAPLVVGTTYFVRFWTRRLTGSDWTQALVGSKAGTSGGPRAWGVVWPGPSWEQTTLSFTPSGTDCADPVLAFCSWGGIFSEVVVAGVTVEHGTPGKALVWDWSEWA